MALADLLVEIEASGRGVPLLLLIFLFFNDFLFAEGGHWIAVGSIAVGSVDTATASTAARWSAVC